MNFFLNSKALFDAKTELTTLSFDDIHDAGFEILSRFFSMPPFFERHILASHRLADDLGAVEALALAIFLSRKSPRLFEAIRNLDVSRTAQESFSKLSSLLDNEEEDVLIAAALAAFNDHYDICEIYGRAKLRLAGSETMFFETAPLSMARVSPSALKLGVVIPMPKERMAKYKVRLA